MVCDAKIEPAGIFPGADDTKAWSRFQAKPRPPPRPS